MVDGLKLLVSEMVDYAGMFPPARLSLESSVENYCGYRDSPQAWLLGSFVCPAGRLDELATLINAHGASAFSCAVVAAPASDGTETIAVLRQALLAASQFADSLRRASIDVKTSLEFRLPPDSDPEASDVPRLFCEINERSTELDVPLEKVFVEVPLGERVSHVANDVASFLWRTNGWFGLKFRTGGLEPAAFPSCAELAHAIVACRDAGVAWKATAGLHQPFRHFDESLDTFSHGFINVVVAAVLSHARKLSEERVCEVLDDASAESFEFTPEQIRWRDWSATADEITLARQTSMVSFGSCSFDEPVAAIRGLGIYGAHAE